ncbi:MAG: succinate dehydrogenase assembly factor 2 [Pseudomonadota bacterium]
MAEDINTRRKRLLHQATYRGFKEADIVIGGFARAHLSTMETAELDEFEALISFSDKQLYEWLMGKQEPPANIIGPVFERMRAFDAAKAVREMTAQ